MVNIVCILPFERWSALTSILWDILVGITEMCSSNSKKIENSFSHDVNE